MIEHIKTNQKGFTIVELLIVIVVIAILAAISIVAYTGIQTRARNSAAFSLASQVSKKAEAYYAINGTYPVTAADFNNATNKEPNLEGAKVTLATAGIPSTTISAATHFSSVTAAYNQFTAGSRVIYVASSTGGYAVIYLKDSTTASVTKGTPPSGTYTFGSNEGSTS